MSWTNELYMVYETQCGREFDDGSILMPIAQSTANAQIEVTLRQDGSFSIARALSKEEGKDTPIPVTEDSNSRTSGNVPMPFADKLKYLAGDYFSYVKEKRAKEGNKFYEAYLRQLKSWRESPFTHPAVDALYAYIEKGCLMRDLLECHVLATDGQTGELDQSHKIAGIAQTDAFVRFRVNGLEEPRTWADQSLQNAFINWNNSLGGDVGLCYATGKMLPVTRKHPKKIRNAGDNAKLISANDDSGFTYRGRFHDADEAIMVSADFSQKMHNALKWLIRRQGITIGSMVMVVWASMLEDLPDIQTEGLPYDGGAFDGPDQPPDTVRKYRDLLRERIFGSKSDMPLHHKVMLLCLDSATTGRLSVSLYAELEKSDFLKNLMKWHEETACRRYDAKRKQYWINSFCVSDILNYAFGIESGPAEKVECKEELRKENMLRLIPCITQGRPLPADFMRALVHKASNPMAYNKDSNHRKALEIACGMIRKYNIDKRRGITAMAYDPNETDRSYLYGCLLAIADAAERSTYEGKEKLERVTNARRYWNAFSARPWQTWGIIGGHLVIYFEKMRGERIRYENMFNEVMSKFDRATFEDNSALSPTYLLGYHHYTAKIYTKKENDNDNKEEESSC